MATLVVNDSILTIYGDNHVVALTFDQKRLFHLKNSTSSKEKIHSSKDPYLGLTRYCAALSNDGKWYAVADDRSLITWSTSDWTQRSIKRMERSASKIIFSPSSDRVLVADKTGDVFEFKVFDDTLEKGVLLLGHLSILLDICMTDNERYIITCDRDEKVRVTCYPNTYNIERFCLGHEAFVTRVVILRDNILLSGSGDGSLKLWNFIAGKNLATYFVSQDVENLRQCIIINISVMNVVHESETIFCLSVDKYNGILVYKYQHNSDITLIQRLACNEPLDFVISGNLLWVLSCSKDTPLQAYVWNENMRNFIDDNSSKVMSAIDLVRCECSFLSDYSHIDLNVLYKKLVSKELIEEKIIKKQKSN